MNIQIFGKKKCFDTKKAERWFSERGIKVQKIDILQKPPSKGELDSMARAVGGIDKILDENARNYASYAYLALESDRQAMLSEDGSLYRTPLVRNGKQATVGFAPEVWQGWQ